MDDSTLLAYSGLQTAAGLLGGVASANLKYKQSRKLMAYQAELNQQAIDKQNEYNLPVNVYQRQMEGLSANGLNPNLVYGSGISGTGQQQGHAESGLGQPGQADFDKAIMAQDLALKRAQIANIEADTNLKKENAETQESVRNRNNADAGYKTYLETWNYATWDLRENTIKLQNAIHEKQYDLIGYYMRNLESTINQRDQITEQTIQTMAQARAMQLKQFELDKKNLEALWKHWKNQDAIGYKNACAMLVSAIAAQESAKASQMQGRAALMNASTQQGYLKIAREKFDKMSDLEQSQLYNKVLNDIAYRKGYLNYLSPFMEGRITLMDSQQNMNQQRTLNMQQQYDLVMPNMFMDFMKFGNDMMP